MDDALMTIDLVAVWHCRRGRVGKNCTVRSSPLPTAGRIWRAIRSAIDPAGGRVRSSRVMMGQMMMTTRTGPRNRVAASVACRHPIYSQMQFAF